MTSDAKVGLLLGLFFIFMIAFLINGLPNFRGETNNNELTTNLVNLENDSLGLAARERRAQEAFNRTELAEIRSSDAVGFQTIQENSEEIRSVTALPKSVSAVEAPKNSTVIEPKIGPKQSLPITATETEVSRHKPSKPTLPTTYVVGNGDNLADIAKKFYGPEEGNKKINVARIFEVNRRVLTSPHEISVGQKLIIPPLSTSDRNKTRSGLPSAMFSKVESIGSRQPSSPGSGTKQSKWYVVRDGDSLWKIAAKQLGGGSRYAEISKLNAGVLDDEDNLIIGMRLRMPAQ